MSHRLKYLEYPQNTEYGDRIFRTEHSLSPSSLNSQQTEQKHNRLIGTTEYCGKARRRAAPFILFSIIINYHHSSTVPYYLAETSLVVICCTVLAE